jgi:DNA-binding response OmpR family regulator
MTKRRGCRILVGDDDVTVLRFLEKALAHYGFESCVCEDGAQVLQRAEPGAFALLLLDYRIGKPDGVEIVQTLRDRGSSTPIILMSSHFPEDVALQCSRMAGVSLLEKPFSLAELQQVIRNALALVQ